MKKILQSIFLVVFVTAVQAQGEPAKDSLQQYTGKYKFPDGTLFSEVTVTLDKGVLLATTSLGSSELKLTEGDVFEVVAYGGTATFKRNADNKINAVHVLVMDVNATGTKEEEGKLE